MASLTSIKRDDIVRIDIRGQRAFALVTNPAHDHPVLGKRGLAIRPIPGCSLTTTFVTARQVIGHWRRSGKSTVDV